MPLKSSWSVVVGFAVWLLAMSIAPAMAEKRVALVIGNDRYASIAPLRKAVNDARAMATVLKGIGFEVISGENLTRRELNRKLAEFDQAIAPGDTALVYFAGHGVAVEGSNYLLSTDIEQLQPGGENTVKDEGHAVTGLIDRIARRGAGVQILILDACRDNPFAAGGRRSVGLDRGLGRVETPSGTFVLMAAGSGQSALDRLSDKDPDPNSVFTRQLIPLLKTPGLTHIDIAKRLQTGVRTLAATVGHSQQPAYYDEVPGTIVINRTPSPITPQPAEVTPVGPVDPDAAARADFAMAERADSREVWQAFIDRHKTGFLVALARQRLAALAPKPPAPEPVVVSPPRPAVSEPLNVPPPKPPAPIAALTTPARPDMGSCSGGAQTVSLASRAAGVLTAAEERCLQPKDVFKECSHCPEMVVVPAGSFTMGSPKSEPEREPDEGPQRTVTIGQPLAIGRLEVTFAEWDACVAGGGCGGYRPKDEGWGRGRMPVINVSWLDAKAYVAWLTRQSGATYRLLTEAEWEYAARGGTTTPFWWGTSISPDMASYDGTYSYAGGTKGTFRARTVPTDSFSANPFGLYQVHGNVAEWVDDCWVDSYRGAAPDGSARTANGCSVRTVRGGSWRDYPELLRSAERMGGIRDIRHNYIGFRVARSLRAHSTE